ncbi:hypothetical protein [Tahibacter sp.]|uniref:hypothetical protein n=1 Tax=Tahibacter sp. TaxID=2056211 RepID=UPI0028C376D5|nr:hypothetical protein [Tahibacter sp.]
MVLADGIDRIERLDLGAQPAGRDSWIGYHHDLRPLARLRAMLDLVTARPAE